MNIMKKIFSTSTKQGTAKQRTVQQTILKKYCNLICPIFYAVFYTIFFGTQSAYAFMTASSFNSTNANAQNQSQIQNSLQSQLAQNISPDTINMEQLFQSQMGQYMQGSQGLGILGMQGVQGAQGMQDPMLTNPMHMVTPHMYGMSSGRQGTNYSKEQLRQMAEMGIMPPVNSGNSGTSGFSGFSGFASPSTMPQLFPNMPRQQLSPQEQMFQAQMRQAQNQAMGQMSNRGNTGQNPQLLPNGHALQHPLQSISGQTESRQMGSGQMGQSLQQNTQANTQQNNIVNTQQNNATQNTQQNTPQKAIPLLQMAQNPFTFGNIVPGMQPIFTPTMSLNMPNPRPIQSKRNTQEQNTHARSTESAQLIANGQLVASNNVQNNTSIDSSLIASSLSNKPHLNEADLTQGIGIPVLPVHPVLDETPYQSQNQIGNSTQVSSNSSHATHTSDINPHGNSALNPDVSLDAVDLTKQNQIQEAKDLANVLDELSLNDLNVRANAGDKVALFKLGMHYYTGKRLTKNLKHTFSLVEQSANRGYAPAMVQMGLFFESGEFGNANPKRSATWFKRAADLEDTDGLFHLARFYDTGLLGQGTEAKRLAMGYYRKAANAGHPEALFNLAKFYNTKDDATRDMGQAVQLYRNSAHLGFAPAQLEVGLMYESGTFLPKDDKSAAQWYARAAIQGLATAQYLLAGMYYEGRGVPQDLDMSIQLYEAAAMQDFLDAQFDLGLLYITSQGKYYNKKKGMEWLQKAADNGDMNAFDILQDLAKKK